MQPATRDVKAVRRSIGAHGPQIAKINLAAGDTGISRKGVVLRERQRAAAVLGQIARAGQNSRISIVAAATANREGDARAGGIGQRHVLVAAQTTQREIRQVAVAEQPGAKTTVTWYAVVEEGLTVMLCVIAVVLQK